jgi:hypothetical protein
LIIALAATLSGAETWAAKEAGIFANDGKGLRTALARARGSTFNAFSSASGLALGQAGVSAGTSEIATLQELLALLDLKGQTVAADAIHCQRETAQTILDKGANYILGFKSNRFAIYDDALLFLGDAATRADD